MKKSKLKIYTFPSQSSVKSKLKIYTHSSRRGQMRGQIKLSFGMIFSIILIIVFLIFAFYAIKTFLGIQNTAQTGKFINDLQTDIDRVWKSTESSEEQEYFLPSKIDAVCFRDEEYENLFFQSDKFFEGKQINHIDTSKMTSAENPYCISNIDGKVKLTLVKEMNEALVTIER